MVDSSEALASALVEVKSAADRATAAAETATAAASQSAVMTSRIAELVTQGNEANRQNFVKLAAGLSQTNASVAVLQRAVFGSDPPPPDSPELTGVPLDEVALKAFETSSQHSLEIPALEGRMINYFAKLEKQIANGTGAGKSGIELLVSPKGLRAITALTALVAAIASIVMAVRQPPPPPRDPAALPAQAASR